MERVGQGGQIRLRAVYSDGAGNVVDPVNPRFDVIDPANVAQVVDAIPTRQAQGDYFYDYDVAANALTGTWRLHATGTINGVAVAGDDVFEVVAAGFVTFDTLGYPTPTELGLTVGEQIASDDPRARLLIDLAFGAIQAEARQYLLPVAGRSFTIHARGSEWIELPERPVRSIQSLSVDGTLWPASEYQLDGSRVWRGAPGWWWPGAVTIVYDSGFEELPNDLRGLTLEVAARLWANPEKLLNEQVEGYSAAYERAHAAGLSLTEAEKRRCWRYRQRIKT